MKIFPISTLEEFFKFELDSIFKSSLDEETKFYLVTLLSRFGHSSNFFGMKDGKLENISTVDLLLEASDLKKPEEKKLAYQQVGDICLYSSSFLLKESSYYQFMGKFAYSTAVSLTKKTEKEIFRNLSSNFEYISKSISRIQFD